MSHKPNLQQQQSLNQKTVPFIKWVGGKRQLIEQIVPHLPVSFNRYYEPFIGGGALFFHLAPTRATLSDANRRLVRAYCGIRDSVEDVITALQEMQAEHVRRGGVEFFKHVRSMSVDSFLSDAIVAAWFIYLNKAGFNGLYRVNQSDQFNVPFGKKVEVSLCDPDNLRACSRILKDIAVHHRDFSAVLDEAVEDDFVYFDPPYVPLNATSSFTSYTADGFGTEDQKRLRDIAFELARRGVHVLLSNSSAPAVRELYNGAHLIEVDATRSVNSKASGRGIIKELLIRIDSSASTGLTVNSAEREIGDSLSVVPVSIPSLSASLFVIPAVDAAISVNPESVREQGSIETDANPNQGDPDMANLPREMADEVGKARVAGGGNYIQHGDYILMIKKWFYQQIQDRCIILEALVIEARKKVVYEGTKKIEQEPNAVGSECSSAANFDGPGKLSARANSRGPMLGLFGFKENEVSDALAAFTMRLVCKMDETEADLAGQPIQPATGMLVQCSTYPKEIRSKKGEYITGIDWDCVAKPHQGVNAQDMVRARLDAFTRSVDEGVKVTLEQLTQARASGAAPALMSTSAGPELPTNGAAPTLQLPVAATPPALPAAPADPFMGWTKHPDNPLYWYKGQTFKLGTDIAAGK